MEEWERENFREMEIKGTELTQQWKMLPETRARGVNSSSVTSTNNKASKHLMKGGV